jgi:hypothetical protein
MSDEEIAATAAALGQDYPELQHGAVELASKTVQDASERELLRSPYRAVDTVENTV